MSLKLGTCDQNALPADKKAFLAPYHQGMAAGLQNMLQFRDESDWRPFSPQPGTAVRDLQQFLKDAGFMPKSSVSGVFGYATQAAARLFQEYLRTVENDATIGTPDGVVGPNTLAHIEAWKAKKAGKPEFVCDWAKFSSQNPSPEFSKWLGLLTSAKELFAQQKDTHPILKLIENFKTASDTKKVADWSTDPNTVYLIGIRRGEDRSVGASRGNDDLFVLLVNGMVFQFWGSTDPNPDMTDRPDMAFLVEGQHEFKFGWHHVGEAEKIYQALQPATSGVLVFRDQGPNFDHALTDKDIAAGLSGPNTSIHIHWSGVGNLNYSAGCQVISGNRYINHLGNVVDCRSFAATKQGTLGNGMTRAAYNLFTDLVFCYAPQGVTTIRYMLGHDETFQKLGWDSDFVAAVVSKLSGGVA